MPEESLRKSLYSYNYRVLTILGGWILETNNPWIRNAYVFFETFMMTGSSFVCFLLFVDFYNVYGNVRKMTWNFSITTLLTGWLVKNNFTLYRCRTVNALRVRLHRKLMSSTAPDDVRVNVSSARELKRTAFFFYLAAIIFVPLWLLSWYFGDKWGERALPVPVWLPFYVDLEDEFMFNVMFFFVSLGGIAGIIFVVTVELAMFAFLIQISREYTRLIKDFRKINDLYEGGRPKRGRSKSSQEMNPCLREVKTKMLLKDLCIRQQELIQYTQDFELIYSYPMFLQFFLAALLFVACALLCITESDKLTLNITYQLGYLFLILMDMLLFCWLATRIRSQCFNVGDAAYSVLWYRMGIDMQKSIFMIIMRSQHPPKITSGKLIEMDLHAFMLLVRNIYSWLTLFQQLAFKSD